MGNLNDVLEWLKLMIQYTTNIDVTYSFKKLSAVYNRISKVVVRSCASPVS